MLLKLEHLRGIAAGEITYAFRKWKRPTVKAGGILRTRVGELAIVAVDAVSVRSVTAEQARRAGFGSKAELLASLADGEDRKLYRVELRLAGEDRRITLREKATLGDEEREGIRARLDRFDRASRRGPWTARILTLIAEHPETRAADLAERMGVDKPWFKGNVRKLKELGLTISLGVGYRLSPRGESFRTGGGP